MLNRTSSTKPVMMHMRSFDYEIHLNASSSSLHKDYPQLNKFIFILRTLLSIFSFFFNFAVIFIFIYLLKKKEKKKIKRTNLLFSLQAIADIMVTLSMVIYTASTFDYNFVWREPSLLGVFLYEYSQSLSLCILLLMTCERFLAIKFPIIHRVHSTNKKIIVFACIGFAVALISPTIAAFCLLPPSQRDIDMHHVLMNVEFLITKGVIGCLAIVTLFSLLSISYAVIYSNINSRIHYISSTRSVENINVGVHFEQRKHHRIIRILITMCTIYLVTLLPGSLYMICFHSSQETEHEFLHWVLEYSFTTLYFSSSLFNPIITLFFHKDIRKILRKCFFVRRGERNHFPLSSNWLTQRFVSSRSDSFNDEGKPLLSKSEGS